MGAATVGRRARSALSFSIVILTLSNQFRKLFSSQRAIGLKEFRYSIQGRVHVWISVNPMPIP